MSERYSPTPEELGVEKTIQESDVIKSTERNNLLIGNPNRKLAPILAAALALACNNEGRNQNEEITGPTMFEKPMMMKVAEQKDERMRTDFDGKQEYFSDWYNGEYSPEERAKRKENSGGVKLFRDVDLVFYMVEPGDSLDLIQQKLIKLDKKRFGYLEKQRKEGKLSWFNIPPDKIVPGMWLPVPFESKDRRLKKDKQFLPYTVAAIEKMKSDSSPYREQMMELLKSVSKTELILAMYALVKQESGGHPIGQNELHRWEDNYKAFSFSYFHILMEKAKNCEVKKDDNPNKCDGPGLRARRRLKRTEGQLYHPQNACELFFGYLFEKRKEYKSEVKDRKIRPAELFPLGLYSNATEFARMYNGGYWKENNPDYARNVVEYYGKALKMFLEKETDLTVRERLKKKITFNARQQAIADRGYKIILRDNAIKKRQEDEAKKGGAKKKQTKIFQPKKPHVHKRGMRGR